MYTLILQNDINSIILYMFVKQAKFTFSEVLRFKDYSIRQLTTDHKSAVLNLMQEQFFKSEPSELAFYKQFPDQKSRSYLYWERVERLFADEIFHRGLSFGAFYVNNGYELVGAAIAKDNSFVPLNDAPPQPGTFLYAVRRLREKMMLGVVPEWYELLNGSSAPMVDLWLIAVKPQHRGKGLVRQMVKPIEHFGALQAYQYSLSWATNTRTAHCYQHLGYQKIAEVDVKEFEDGGVKYFREIEEEQRQQSLWLKKLERPSQMALQEAQ